MEFSETQVDGIAASLRRCAFLLHRICVDGDVDAMKNAGAAVRQATEVLQDAGFFGPLEGEEEEELTDADFDEPRCEACGGVIGVGGVEGTCADCCEDPDNSPDFADDPLMG